MSLPPPADHNPAPLAANPERWFAEEVHPHGPQLQAYRRSSFPALRAEVEDIAQESFLRF